MREIVFDTETTGLNPASGDRMVEIGCVEIFNRVETGRHYHCYFNPEREMPFEAEAVHGLSTIFLSDKPCFPTRQRSFSTSSTTRPWSRIMRASTSDFSISSFKNAASRRCRCTGWSIR